MAIDYIIGGLQLLSAAVNVLALGAFWVTPGLRTIANRFVINLLVVNVIGCLALTPALWLHGGLKPEQMIHSSHIDMRNNTSIFNGINIGNRSPPSISSHVDVGMTNGGIRVATAPMSTQDKIDSNNGKMIKSKSARLIKNGKNSMNFNNFNRIGNNNHDLSEIEVEIVDAIHEEDGISILHRGSNIAHDGDNVVPKNSESTNSAKMPSTKNIFYSDCTRFWGFDLVAALGGLSVVLVVGDTWCAVTDPLRYHSRISGLKSWILILSMWFISTLFCIASALRSDCRLVTTEITSTLENAYRSRAPSVADDDTDSIIGQQKPNRNSDGGIWHDTVEFNEFYNLIYSCTFFVVTVLLPFFLICTMYWKIFAEARQNGMRIRQNGSSPLLQSAFNLATVPSLPLDTITAIGEEDDSGDTCVVTVLPALRRNSAASPNHGNISMQQLSLSEKNRAIYMHRHHQRYLEIPKCINNMPLTGNDITDNTLEASPSEAECSFDRGDLRQVRSTPDLQKSITAELLVVRQTIADHGKKIHSASSIHTSFSVQPPMICTPPKASSYVTSIRHRLSNASSIFKYREESRAARISILVVIMFLFSYFPYGLLVLLQGRVTFIANSSFLGVIFLLIASTSSPFIFAYRNRRVRRGVCRLFGVDTKTNEKQRILMRSNYRDKIFAKPKNTRISRNTVKSASFTAPRSHGPLEYSPVILPIDTSEESNTQMNVWNTAK